VPCVDKSIVPCVDITVMGSETSITFISVINQLDVQYFCFIISLFHASTCFEHMCSKHVEA